MIRQTKQQISRIGFHYAWAGVCQTFLQHINFRIHVFISLVVVVAGLWLQISLNHWLWLLAAIVWGLTVELINTAVEATVDLATDKWHPLAKAAKDAAAGAMLITALGTAVIGSLVFSSYLFS